MTIENNKLLAKFMGTEFINNNIFINRLPKDFLENSDCYKCFHNSYDWLMEVVEKINSNKNHYIAIDQIPQNKGKFYSEAYGCNDFEKESRKLIASIKKDTLIQTVYNACIEFVKWYNEQNN